MHGGTASTGTARPLNGVNQPRLAPARPPGALIWAQSKDQSLKAEINTPALREANVFRHARHLRRARSRSRSGGSQVCTKELSERIGFVLSCFEVKMKESEASLISGFEGL